MKRTFACTTAALFALLAFSPTGAADDDPDGDLSRTFLSHGQIEWKPHTGDPSDGIGGAGWYNPDDRGDLCLVRLFGLTFSVGFYYETKRITTNWPNIQLLSAPQVGVDIPATMSPAHCPLDPTVGDQFVGSSPFNVWISGTVGQSHLLCVKVFKPCLPDPATARWLMQDCDNAVPAMLPDFQDGAILGLVAPNPMPPPDFLSVLGGSTSLDDDACGNDVPSPWPCEQFACNFTSYLSPQLGNQASLPDPHVDQVVPVGAGTTYVMSCFSIDYTWVNDVPPFNTLDKTANSHDYFLVLDPTDADDLVDTDGDGIPDETVWGNALQTHFGDPQGGPNPKKDVDTNSLFKAGFYDLNGDNGFNCDEPAVEPFEKPKKDDPLPVVEDGLREPLTCIAFVTAPLGGPATVVQANCVGGAAVCAPLPGATSPTPTVIVVSCTADQACIPIPVAVTASVSGAATDSVASEVFCNGSSTGAAALATGPTDSDRDLGFKTHGNYECRMTFVVSGAADFRGVATCQDDP